MFYVVTKCDQCPFLRLEDATRLCNVSEPAMRPLTGEEDRPQWCALRQGQIAVRDFPGGASTIVVERCNQCPFLSFVNGRRACNVATPCRRPIFDEDERPTWCKMLKEQIIVRDFK